MSLYQAEEPRCRSEQGSVALRIEPIQKDLGAFCVRRVLPATERRMVGPFIFFDHMGPSQLPPGEGIQVRPHPHIGIATITYLFEGLILHRDSLGYVQPIRPGAVNLMTAGRGIVHSERAGDDLHTSSTLHGIQSWLALPDDLEECPPDFLHVTADEIPQVQLPGARVRVIMGTAFGRRSPVPTSSPTLYLECQLSAGSSLRLPEMSRELAVYPVSGALDIDGAAHPAGVMAVAADGASLTLRAREDALVMVIGGDPVGERHIWWNLVSSRKARIEQAKTDWKTGRFAGVPDDPEFIPLPE